MEATLEASVQDLEMEISFLKSDVTDKEIENADFQAQLKSIRQQLEDLSVITTRLKQVSF